VVRLGHGEARERYGIREVLYNPEKPREVEVLAWPPVAAEGG
jgi:hypothetical protein